MKYFNFRLFAVIFVAVVIVCLVIILSGLFSGKKRSDANYLALLRQAYSTVLTKYVDKPDPQKIVKSMIDGMLSTLDPHSAYLPPEPYHEMEVQISGAFGGVGIELGVKDGKLIVISPIEDTPAFRAGIHSGDIISRVDGVSTVGMSITAAVKRMRGEAGTPVSLTVFRADSPKPLAFKMIRAIIKVKSLKARVLEPGYGLIRVAQFQTETAIEFKKALETLHKQSGGNLKGLIIDLRYNPGGLLDSSVQLVNNFIGDDSEKRLIVSIKGRHPDANHEFNSTGGEKEPDYPIVVLINGGSASASEIVAGALQDHKRAVIMGQQSFGKGSVQSIFQLSGNSALKLTTARYYTPSGRSIQVKGITPDIEVGTVRPVAPKISREPAVHEKDLDNILDKEKVSETVLPTAKSRSVLTEMTKNDYQLERALDLLKSLNSIVNSGFNLYGSAK